MKVLALLMLVTSCALVPKQRQDSPSWVEGIRTGQERLRVTSGSKTLYRRIAETCDKATTMAEADIEREYQRLMKYNLEVMYYDRQNNDCAVTVSVDTGKAPAAVDESDQLLVRNLYRQRAQNAIKNAYTGMNYATWVLLTKDRAPIVAESGSPCYKDFETVTYSTHGTTVVCWRGDILQGYCDTITGKCDKKYP